MFKDGMVSMIQKAKKMQEDMQIAQEEIKSTSCQGESGSGAVKITLNGEYRATNIQIDESLLTDKEILEDLIMTALNDASSQVSEISKAKLKNVTGGINLPF
jgi:DNA-binding YbaB/EbfC family protein